MVRASYQEISEQYEEIKRSACGRQACTVLILVAANEVDAMASARMLTQLLRTDNIAYTLRPVSNFAQASQTYRMLVTPDIKTVIMINCGAIYNLPKLFGLEHGGDTRVFVMDNHRPFHLANIHSRHQVVVFDDANEIEADYGFMPSDGSDVSEVDDSATSDEDDEDELDQVDGDDEDLIDGGESDEEAEFRGDADGDNESEAREEEAEEAEEAEEDNNDGDAADEEGGVEDEDEGDGEDIEADNEDGYEGGEGEENEEEEDADAEAHEAEEASHELDTSGATSREGDDDGDDGAEGEAEEIGGGVVNRNRRRPREETNDDDEEEEKVVGRRRRVLAEMYDPVRLRRRKLREYYGRVVGYAPPTAIMMMNLVGGRWGAHIPLDIIWQAVLGVTDQHQRARITDDEYHEYCGALRMQLSEHLGSASERVRYTVGEGDEVVVVPGAETGHIEEGPEFRFFLYRHWSLFDAMYHSSYVASKIPVWQAQGTAKLQELLAKMGVPLDQCKQSWNFMQPALRTHFRRQITNDVVKEIYGLRNPDVLYRSFFRYNSFKNPVAAADVVFAASALLEMYRSTSSDGSSAAAGNDMPVEEQGAQEGEAAGNGNSGSSVATAGVSRLTAFNEAYDCLGMRAEDLLRKGLQAATSLQKIVVRKAAVMLDGHDSISRLSRLYFAYLYLTGHGATSSAGRSGGASGPLARGSGLGAGFSASEDAGVDAPFTRPLVLAKLGQFIMEVKRNMSKKQGGWVGRKGLLPLFLISERQDSFLVMGISPLNTTQGAADLDEEDQIAISKLTNFRQIYKLAARELRIKPRSEAFDSNIIEIAREDVHDFLGTLDYVLKQMTPNHFREAAH